jgi:hypothetical protein
MEKLLNITVNGNTKTWGFQFVGDDEYLDEWRDDGLDVDEVVWEVNDG